MTGGPKGDTADRRAGIASMTAEHGKVRMGILTSDNRENFILFTPEEAREWANSMNRGADQAATQPPDE